MCFNVLVCELPILRGKGVQKVSLVSFFPYILDGMKKHVSEDGLPRDWNSVRSARKFEGKQYLTTKVYLRFENPD